jgi:hypothetical protein
MLNRIFSVVLGLVIGLGTSAHAGDAVLTLKHSDQILTFDRAALEAMGTETIETTTIWTQGLQSFEGVSLARLVQVTGVQDGKLLATAINDYSIEIPLTDAVVNGPIVALKLNGKEMSVRDKGPLWIIYPYDSNANYRTEVIYSRSIWQLNRIEVAE